MSNIQHYRFLFKQSPPKRSIIHTNNSIPDAHSYTPFNCLQLFVGFLYNLCSCLPTKRNIPSLSFSLTRPLFLLKFDLGVCVLFFFIHQQKTHIDTNTHHTKLQIQTQTHTYTDAVMQFFIWGAIRTIDRYIVYTLVLVKQTHYLFLLFLILNFFIMFYFSQLNCFRKVLHNLYFVIPNSFVSI